MSVENQTFADNRIPVLVEIPAAVRFLSCEPLLGPIDLGRWINPADAGYESGGPQGWVPDIRIHWVITGGESGAHRRPANPDWFRSIRDQCEWGDVAYFHKQGNATARSRPVKWCKSASSC